MFQPQPGCRSRRESNAIGQHQVQTNATTNPVVRMFSAPGSFVAGWLNAAHPFHAMQPLTTSASAVVVNAACCTV